MKRENVVILPLDGYESGEALMSAMEKILEHPDMARLISHIKINDGVHNMDMGGPEIVNSIIEYLQDAKLPIGLFLDLKIFDVSATLVNVLKKYEKCPPDILTVCSSVSVAGIIELRKMLPNTKLAMVSVLTDIGEAECLERFDLAVEDKISIDLGSIRRIYQKRLSSPENENLPKEPFDLVVCSPHELDFLKSCCFPEHYGFIVPGIRDKWMKKANEHQKRTTGVKEALDLGATYVVMGAQMTKGNPEKGISPEESRRLTLEEINSD